MAKKDIINTFKSFIPKLNDDNKPMKDHQIAQFLFQFFNDVHYFDMDEKDNLKKAGYKLLKFDDENGDYHESVYYTVVVQNIKDKKKYQFVIYDNGQIATDAISLEDKFMVEVKAKKKKITVYE